jgi:hypothetical protein
MSAQLATTIRTELESELAAGRQKLSAERDQLKRQRQQLDQLKGQMDEQVQAALAKERAGIAAKARVEAQQAVAIEIEDRDEQLKSFKQQLKNAQQQELALRKQQRELQQREEQLKLEVTRQIDQERQRIRDDARKQTQEEDNLKIAEERQKSESLRKQLQELQRRLEQGSQQTQGEVQEIALESLLGEAFLNDVIEPVAKGIRGGDALHHVFDHNGRECGTILWESKRTKNWSDQWLSKVIDDQQQAKASCACIVSSAIPSTFEHFGEINGVWVTSWPCVRSAAVALRAMLIEAAQSRRAIDGQHGKMELVYDYLSGPEFRNRIRGLVEPYAEMEADLAKEKRAIERIWNKRHKQLERALTSTSGLYGDLQGIIGNGLKEIEGMDLLAIADDETLDATKTD